ncbi:MAG: hypothetical protein HUU08_04560 [Candidatus Brocadia sp.]|nr:hypothetical protein [Candidatus Brocadia sp.]
MKLLVVVDKLLAGFDASPCTYLYIDKSMQYPGFFQAICRVNLLDSDDKESEYALEEIRNASGETLDMNTYEADMRLLIDTLTYRQKNQGQIRLLLIYHC